MLKAYLFLLLETVTLPSLGAVPYSEMLLSWLHETLLDKINFKSAQHELKGKMRRRLNWQMIFLYP